MPEFVNIDNVQEATITVVKFPNKIYLLKTSSAILQHRALQDSIIAIPFVKSMDVKFL